MLGGAKFHDAAGVHDGDASGNLRDDRKTMRNKDVGQAEFALEFLQEEEDLRAHGNVERGDGLIGDDEFGFKMRARAMPMRWRWPPENSWGYLARASGAEANSFEDSRGLRFALGFGKRWFMDGKRLGDDFADAHPGVEDAKGS